LQYPPKLKVPPLPVRELGAAAQPVFFFPYDGEWPWMSLVVRTTDAAAGAGVVRGAIARFDPSLPVPTIEPMSESIRRATALPRFRVRLVGAFASAAVLLAALGLYGVMSYVIRRRTREIGIRLALGAVPGRINRMVIRDGGRIALAGLVVGTVASLAMARVLRPLLFETNGFEPAVYGAVLVLLAVLTLAATLPAARRAMRIDPAEILKEED
jgi:ABC-type antimicrobial peptide transport system permease subunit